MAAHTFSNVFFDRTVPTFHTETYGRYHTQDMKASVYETVDWFTAIAPLVLDAPSDDYLDSVIRVVLKICAVLYQAWVCPTSQPRHSRDPRAYRWRSCLTTMAGSNSSSATKGFSNLFPNPCAPSMSTFQLPSYQSLISLRYRINPCSLQRAMCPFCRSLANSSNHSTMLLRLSQGIVSRE
jgi:hypothetical protein